MAPDARAYAYDPIGNRKTATGWDKTAQAPTASSYQANSLNQYATVNAAALIYDLDGNLTEDANKSYTYDGENRLLSVTPKVPGEGDGKATFAYDYMGRRVKKESYAYQSSAWTKTDETRYLYDGWNMIRELDASGATKRSYVWGIDLSGTLQGAGGIGGLIASVDATTSAQYHYFNDANGNVGQLTERVENNGIVTGNTVAHYEYDPFGNVTYAGGPMAASNPYRFSTKYHDDETTLVYYGYRYYAPTLGRWLNRDPIGERGGLNIYLFVYNRATTLVDPLGLFSFEEYLPELSNYLTPGLGFSHKYYIPINTLGGFEVTASAKLKTGTCCDGSTKRIYKEWSADFGLGAYLGLAMPGGQFRTIAPILSNAKVCPSPVVRACVGLLRADFRVSIFSLGCTYDIVNASWQCAGTLIVWGGDLGSLRFSAGGIIRCSETTLL